ncbi:MAG: LipL32 family surface lipoprotein [Spirochaetales bacterium]|nr:LipL32 family surface lipoprotein [Spirochaetales bacterium]
MKIVKVVLTTGLIWAALFLTGCSTTGLGKFGAEMGSRYIPVAGTQRIPYSSTVRYFGYIEPDAEPDAVVNGKKFNYLYVWVPLVAPELGVRMVSPVLDMAAPEEGDIVDPLWETGQDDWENFFDTYIVLERAATIVSPDQILDQADSTKWITYAQNDDSREMPADPDGRNYNSLMRVVSDPSDPLKALVAGLYRIGFTTYKVGEVQGTFFAEVGAPVNMPGTYIARDLETLVQLIEE